MNISTRSEMNVIACNSANALKKFLSRIAMMLSLFVLVNETVMGQSPTRFSSGMFASPNSWAQGSSVAMGTIANTNIHTTTANASGNSYFRFYSATSGGTTYEPNGASDILLTAGTSRALEIAGSGKSFYLNVGSPSNNIVFKTSGSGTPGSSSVVCFEIQGAVRSISALTQPSSTIVPGGTATVSVTLDGALATGQAVWLRYTTNNFSSSTCAKMTGSGTSYSATIPVGANTAGATVIYYAFTSGDVASITGANADLFTINLINNGGSNYQYTVASNFYSKSAGSANLQTPSNWGTATDGSGTAPVDFAQNGVTYNIRNSATATIGGNWTISGTTTKIVVGDGTSACTFTVPDPYTVSAPVSTDISNNATIKRSTTNGPTWGTLTVANGGTFDHAVDGYTIPTATWGATSTCKVSAVVSTAPAGTTQTFGIVTWECSGQNAPFAVSSNFFFTSPTVNIVSTGSSYLNTISDLTATGSWNIQGGRVIANLNNLANRTLTIQGNLSITGGTFEISNTSGSVIHSLIVNGNVTINGGILDINKSATNAGRLYVKGNLSVQSGSLSYTQASTTGTSGVYFDGSGTQTFTYSGGTLSTASGGVGRRFYYKTSSGPTINEVYSATTRTVNGSQPASLGVAGYAPLATISAFTINTSAAVTLSESKTISGTLTLSSGSLDLGGQTLTLNSGSSSQSVAGGGSNAFNITNGTISLTGSGAHTITLSNFGTTSSGGLTLGTDVTLRMDANAALNCGGDGTTSSMLTVLGTLQLNSGTVSNIDGGRPPFYGSNSTLRYSTSYNVFDEWRTGTAITTPGVPQNVEINGASITVTTPASARTAAGNLTITNGTFTLGNQLSVGGNWNRAGGTFTPGANTVVLTGSNSTITDGSGASFYNLTISKSSSSNTVTLVNSTTVTNTLTLTTGIVVTESSKILNITGTTTGAISGGGATSYISGPLTRSLPSSLTSGSTYVFPVGKSTGSNTGYYPISLVNPTTSTGAITITAEAFNTGSGGSAGTGLSAISSTEYWSVASSGNFTNSSYSVTRPSAVSPSNAIGRLAAATANGAYAAIGGTASGSSITSSSTANGAAQQFFVLGVLAVPTLSTNSITSITNTTATGGGNTLSDGGSSITAKGVCWNTATGPTTSNSTTSDGTGTANYSSSITGLSPQTLYYVRAYATNANATSYGSEVTFRTLSTEPTSATTNFAASAQSTSQINLSWTAATFPASGVATNNGYIILRRQDGANPTTTGVTDGVAPGSLSLASGTTLAQTVTSGATTSFNNTGLTVSLPYNYMIIPFTWDGTNAATYNYNTTSPQTASATTYIFVSQVTTGRPITGTFYTGDKINTGSTYYFNFQVDQITWDGTEVGIGQNTDGTTGWSWATANFYADNLPSKRVRRDIAEFQFTATGTWYVAGRARAASTDPWSYADASTSTNDGTLTLSTSSGNTPYFTVSTLDNPTIVSATASSSSQIDLNWTKFAGKDVLIVRYPAAASITAPTTNVSYTAGNSLGAGTVVYKGSATSVNSTGLSANTSYKFVFYSENYGYYSSGVTSSSVTTPVGASVVVGSLTDFGTLCVGSTSSEQSYSVTGSNLTANVTVTPPVGFQISTTSGSGFVSNPSTITLNQVSGSVNTTIYVRFVPGSATTFNSNITHATTGVSTSNVSVTGSGLSSGTWVGGAIGNWTTAANWCGGLPTSTTDVVIPNGSTVTVDGAASVQSITINGTLQGSSNTLTVSGNLTNNGTFTAGAGTVAFNATATVGGTSNTTFNNVNISAGVDFGASKSTINGTLRILGGGFVNTNAPTYASGSTLRYNINNGTYGRGDEWRASNPGIPHHVVIAGNTTLNYPNTNDPNTTNRTINGDLTVESGSNFYMDFGTGTSNGSVTVAGNVSLAGDLSLGDGLGGDLYVGGNWTHTSGTLNNNGRSVYFNGSGTQTINNAETFANLRVDKSSGGSLVLTGNTTVTSTITLTAANNATLVVNPGVVLTFATGQFNGNPVVLKSSAVGTAAIGNITGTLTGATAVTVERYVPGKKAWRFLTTPLKGSGTIFDNWQNTGSGTGMTIFAPGGVSSPASNNSGILLAGVNSSILQFNSGSGSWQGVSSTTAGSSLFATPGGTAGGNKSYAVFVTGPFGTSPSASAQATTLKPTGTLQSGTVTFSNLAAGQYHLIGNPYASPVDLTNVISGSGSVNTIYVWDAQASGIGAYRTWNVSTGWALDAPTGGSSYGSLPIVQSGQAFFVRTTGTTTLTFNESDKVSNSTNNVTFRTSNTNDQRIRFDLNRMVNNVAEPRDAVQVRYDASYNTSVDDNDIYKMANFSDNLSLRRNGSDLLIERRSMLSPTDTIYLRTTGMAQTSYRLTVSFENFSVPAGLTAVLQDLSSGSEQPITLGQTNNIGFVVNSGNINVNDRFRIVFRGNVITPVTNLNGEKGFSVYPNPVAKGGNAQIEFRNKPAGKYTVTIYTIAGVQVQQSILSHGGGTGVQSLKLGAQLPSGTYIAEITQMNGVREKVKVVVGN